MPCELPDCRHRPKRVRSDRPRCKSCARSEVLRCPRLRNACAENMTRGRIEKASRAPMRGEYQHIRKMLGASEARRVVADHLAMRGEA